jgi:hypothetical protein
MQNVQVRPATRSERVRFRCWKCRHRFGVARTQIGRTLQCDCGENVRVPSVDHGNCRVRTILDYLVEAFLCGGGCALIGFLAAMYAFPPLGFHAFGEGIISGAAVVAVGCGLFGMLFGERALDMVGAFVRARERD